MLRQSYTFEQHILIFFSIHHCSIQAISTHFDDSLQLNLQWKKNPSNPVHFNYCYRRNSKLFVNVVMEVSCMLVILA